VLEAHERPARAADREDFSDPYGHGRTVARAAAMSAGYSRPGLARAAAATFMIPLQGSAGSAGPQPQGFTREDYQ